VTAVGGTKLHLGAAGNRISADTAWNDTYALPTGFLSPWASSGGPSAVFRRPWYQDPARGIVGARRGVPDVSMSAALTAGVLVYSSYPGNQAPFFGWTPGGGTSEATPELAGIVAIADQYARHRLGLINPALYALEARHAPGIVDVVKGSNTVSFVQPNNTIFTLRGYRAKHGYDLVTGVGTVNAARLAPELAQIG
jgi:subtilase family serine protease